MGRLLFAILLAAASSIATAGVGFDKGRLPGSNDYPAVPYLVFYPTDAHARTVTVGPYRFRAAPHGPPLTARGLVVVSHGSGGGPLSLLDEERALAASGWLVAAPMHLGDSFGHDQRAGTRGMFIARARSVSALVDHLTDAPRWRGRWPEDRIAVLGYSAGGATALALIGARASMKAVVAHCAATPGEGLCRRGAGKRGSEELRRVPDLSDPRIGAAVLFAPVTAPFTDRALARLDRPVLAVRAGLDTELLYPQHAARLATAAPRRVRLRTLHGAGHFAFLTLPQAAPLPPGMAEAKGFDRAAAHRWLESRVERFLDAAFGAGTAERRPSQPDG